MVWEGVGGSAILALHRGRATSLEYDVKAVTQGPLRLGRLKVEARDQALARLSIAHGLKDRVLVEEGVAGEVHLGDEPAPEGWTEEREVYVSRAPGVVMVAPRVGTGLERDEPVTAVVVGEAPARAGEVGVQRRRVPVTLMNVAPGGVGLPDLDQAASHGPPVAVEHASGDEDALSQGLAFVLTRQVVVQRPYPPVAVGGPGDLREGLGQDHEWLIRSPQARRLVVGVQVRGVGIGLAGP